MKIKIKFSLKCAFCGFTLYDYVTMHGAKNTKNSHRYVLQKTKINQQIAQINSGLIYY